MSHGAPLIPIPHLRSLWSRIVESKRSDSETWAADNTVLYGLGLGLLETLQYLHEVRPSYASFERWILAKQSGAVDAACIARINAALQGESAARTRSAVFSAEELAHFDRDGWVVLHDAIPQEACQALTAAIYEFLGMSPGDPDTWYGGPQGHSIWVPMRDHALVKANRESPRVYAAFSQLWNRADLFPTIDQVGFNPPARADWPFPGPFLHCDVSLAPPIPFGTQGILYLTDTAAEQGAFQCVSGFQHRVEAWLESLPPGVNPRDSTLLEHEARPIAGRAGDLIIWHQALPHGATPNRSRVPRIVQYINMRPPDFEESKIWV